MVSFEPSCTYVLTPFPDVISCPVSAPSAEDEPSLEPITALPFGVVLPERDLYILKFTLSRKLPYVGFDTLFSASGFVSTEVNANNVFVCPDGTL